MEPEKYEWTCADLAKLVPGAACVVQFRHADGTYEPQLRIVALYWRGHCFLLSGDSGRKFQRVLLEQCDPASLTPASAAVAAARGGAG